MNEISKTFDKTEEYNCISIFAELRTMKTRARLEPAIRRARFIQLLYISISSECGILCDLVDKEDCYANVRDDVKSSETKITPFPEHALLGFGRPYDIYPIYEIGDKHKVIIEEINFKVMTSGGNDPTSTFNVIVGLKIFQEREKIIMGPRLKYKTAFIEIRNIRTKVKVDPPTFDAKFIRMFYMTSAKENGIFCDLVDEINSYTNIRKNKVVDKTELKPSTFIGYGK